MSSARLVLLQAGSLLSVLVGAVLPGSMSAGTPVVAVYSRTMHGYARTLQTDNTFKPETYAFADGGRLPGNVEDHSIDDLKFAQVAGVVAASLKRQNYIPTTDPKGADLLIFVSFGTTVGLDEEAYQTAMSSMSADFSAMNEAMHPMGGVGTLGPSNSGMTGTVNSQQITNDLTGFWGIDGTFDRIALANQARDQANERNAGILGYDQIWHETNVMRPYLATARDVLHEIEESRYFVVLQAYDFQALRQHKGKKLLWETRYSIARHGVRFDEQLVDMTRYASQFCGQNVDHLVRRHLREGRIEIGTPTVVPTSAK